ncbi:MAG: arylsulfatase [Phycisphaerales bacterium]|nr:arylsulfatase [Phycisphaerales bacterium]
MSHRMHTFLIAIAFVLVTDSRAFPQTPKAGPATPPNIVFIMADDLGYGEVGCFGQKKIQTPNIDRLAAEGLRLTRHYSGSAVCAPTRCSLLTGRHTGHAVIRGNKEVGGWGPEDPEGQWPLPASEVTIAEVLKARGYATGAFGKWGLGGPGSEGHPCFQGFDHFYGYLCQRVAHNYYPTHLWRNHDVDVLGGNHYFSAHQRLKDKPLLADGSLDPAGFDQFRGKDYAPEEIITELLGWIRAQHRDNPDRPFFCYYPTIIPHVALQTLPEWTGRYPEDWDQTSYLGEQGYLPNARPHAAYAGVISYMDHNVGRILDLLDELGLTDNTIVVFTSDNGATYVGGVDRAFFDSHAGLRGQKGNLYEGGIRMPTVVRWPGHTTPGASDATPSYHPDWLPTLASIAGASAPADLDGTSLVPVLSTTPIGRPTTGCIGNLRRAPSSRPSCSPAKTGNPDVGSPSGPTWRSTPRRWSFTIS